MTRAVITGAGAVCAFGVGLDKLFSGLAQGGSRIAPIRSFDASAFETKVACEVDVNAIGPDWLHAHTGAQRSLLDQYHLAGAWRDRKCAFGLLAAVEAWRMAGCGAGEREASLVMALGLEQGFMDDFAPYFHDGCIDWREEAGDRRAALRFRSDVDLGSRIVADFLVLDGPVIVNASACAAGTLALAHAASLIERGAASVVLCGGADSMVNPFGMGGMSRLGAPSPRAAADACRPFDRRRDGLVIGEGAAMFVMESEERAARRGARVLARVLGYGSTQDAYRVTAPRLDGAAAQRAMQLALARAQLDPSALGYINAHGTGTPLNDAAEARAIRAVFGAHADILPVSSIKGAIGHLMAASGAIEAASCLLAFERGLLPGTANHLQKDAACDVLVIGEAPREARVDAVLSNSFGFGGQNVSLILGRPC
ncbi:beta-ketoacyl-[acyl-carrier-protein] synthase family protein [Massilia sp. TWP1-3-3]|uniref:beta-ketoacyl-[acyl-carrier-protein] synthase family protein n=1 Tax=Massilia sp. TWP1-3-3 TaxID=2804573 RepID=UPI003CE675C4